jgi:glycosyltransferase involved in cell wall biosynthesis
VTGLLCRDRDSVSLADAMLTMARMSPAELQAMGAAGRAKMAREFSEEVVVQAYLDALAKAIPR